MLTILLISFSMISTIGQEFDLVDIVQKDERVTILTEALQIADLLNALKSEGPFTVFAPTDQAFAKLPERALENLLSDTVKLKEILLYHIVNGFTLADNFIKLNNIEINEFKTLNKKTIKIKVDTDGVFINQTSKVIQADILAKNGVIHIIDTVLLPLESYSEQGSENTVNPERDQVRSLIQQSINLGVPLYNSGSYAACEAIYRITLQAIENLTEGIVDRKLITNTIREAESKDPKDGAWVLRYMLDEIYSSNMKSYSPEREKTIFDFSDQDASEWYLVNDNVMGGISKGQVEQTEQETMKFWGRLSLKNNGGFSSVRSQIPGFFLAGYDGLRLKIRGDGREYSVLVSSRQRRGTWQTKFKTSKKWETVKISFKEMKMSIRGWRPNVSPKIAGDRIRTIGFIIADKNEKSFGLEVDWIKAYVDQK